jgi:hypothetical protein
MADAVDDGGVAELRDCIQRMHACARATDPALRPVPVTLAELQDKFTRLGMEVSVLK